MSRADRPDFPIQQDRSDDAAGKCGFFLPEVPGFDWPAIMQSPRIPLVVTNDPAKALRFCLSGQPAIAITGVSKATITKLLCNAGALVQERLL